MPSLHRAARRGAGSLMPGPRLAPPRPGRSHGGRAPSRWRARSSPDGIRPRGRRPVRFLHARHAALGARAPCVEPVAHRARRARGARRESLPLHRLHEDHRGRARRIGGPLMRLRPFALAEPESVREAVEILARPDGDARIIAGGTALVPTMRLGLITPDRLVSLHRIPGLSQVRVDKGVLEVGAMTSLAALARHGALLSGWPLLTQAASRVATPAIRSTATLGGNLCYAEAASDPAP